MLLLFNSGNFIWAPGYEQDDGLVRALLLSLLALGAFALGNRVGARPRWRHKTRKTPDKEIEKSSRSGPELAEWILPIALIIVGMALKFYLIGSLGGPAQTVALSSAGARDRLGLDGPGTALIGIRTLSGIADAGAAWLLIDALRLRRRVLAQMLLFSLVIATSYVTIGKRLTLILPIFCIIIAWHYYRTPILAKTAPLALLVVSAAGMASLLFRVFLPANTAQIAINLDSIPYAHGSIFLFYLYSLEFASVEMIAVSITSANEINGLFGGQLNAYVTTNIVPFSFGIPRAVFPGKPSGYFDLSQGVSSVVLGNNLADTQVGYAPTIIGTSYISGGILGVFVALFLVGRLARYIDDRTAVPSRCTASVVYRAIALVLVFQVFRQGTLGWTFIVAIVQQYGFIVGILGVRLFQNVRRPATTTTGNDSRMEALKCR